MPKVRVYDAVNDGEYADNIVYNNNFDCYLFEYTVNTNNLKPGKTTPNGGVSFFCEFATQAKNTKFYVAEYAQVKEGDRFVYPEGEFEIYWNGVTKYTISKDDYIPLYNYDDEGNRSVATYTHCIELPNYVRSIVIRAYPRRRYKPAFYVGDASSAPVETLVNAVYNSAGGYYEIKYDVTNESLYKQDGSLYGFISLWPYFNFDQNLYNDGVDKERVYFDNSKTKWDKVYAWAWKDTDGFWGMENGFEAWPGIELQKDEKTGYYYWEGVDLEGANVIFGNGAVVTNDATAKKAAPDYVCKPTDTDDNGKYNAVWESIEHKHIVENVILRARPNSAGYILEVCTDPKCYETFKETCIYEPTTIVLTNNSCVYDGKAKKPTVKVLDSKNREINQFNNYDVSYKNNVNEGVATVTVTFKGDYYAGTMKSTFKINKANNKITGVTGYTRVSSAKAQVIRLGLKAAHGTIKYKSNKINIKVDSKGNVTIPRNFVGQVVITATASAPNYTTVKKDIKITFRPNVTTLKSVKNITGKKDSRGIIVAAWNKIANVSGYQVQYSISSTFAFGNKAILVKGVSNLSQVITGLAKNKTYYVRVRTFKTVAGTNWYSNWSAQKSVKIGK